MAEHDSNEPGGPLPVMPVASSDGTREFDSIPARTGADTNFRLERFRPSLFAPLVVRVQVTAPGAAPLSPEVVDVSQSSVALRWPAGLPIPKKGAELHVRLAFDEQVLWDGPAYVRRLEDAQIAVTFTGLLDLEAMQEMATVRAWKAPLDTLAARDWGVDGYATCRALLGDFRILLEDVRARLDHMDRDIVRPVWHGSTTTPAMRAVIQRVHTEVVAPMVALSDEINEAYVAAGPGALKALRRYAHRQLQAQILTSPFMHRALAKPLRYPGDYLLMNYIYRDGFAGDSLFARTMTAFGVGNRTGDAVRGRKDMVLAELRALIKRREGSDRPIRILAVAAGPAEEAWELLTTTERFDTPVEIVLFEQDRAALTFAYRRLTQALAGDRHPNVRVFFRNDSVTKLIYTGPDEDDLEHYDAVYSCGLFDYFGDPAWTRVARALASCLAPGGTLWIGNMVPESPARWFMELHLDWTLKYRTEEQLLQVARASAPTMDVQLRREPTGVNPFARIERV